MAAAAEHVRIAEEELPAYAERLPRAGLEPRYDEDIHYRGEADATLAYLLILDAVNFGSGYFPHLRKPPGRSGYHVVALGLTKWLEREGVPSAGRLARLTGEEVASILGQPPGDAVRGELMGLFARALRDLGDLLLRGYGGSYVGLREAAGASAARLVDLLAAMPFYRDVAPYRGAEVPFYKRAQITASDLALAFGGEGYGRFDDLGDLTLFADNLVPHVLHTDGVLRYSEELRARLDRRELLEPGSPEEVELRAASVYAAELLVRELARQGVETSAREVDILLWNRGQDARYRRRARHRCRTVFY